MPSYLLVMHQSGGCDYTIACGTKTVHLGNCTLEKAVAEVEQIIEDYGDDRIDEVELYEVTPTPFDYDAHLACKKAERKAKRQAAQERKERAELARLKAQYGE